MPFNVYLLLAAVLLLCSSIRSSQGGTKYPCPESVDIASIHITKCPQNRKEMEERAKTFKCESRQQNCTTRAQYKYHCVLNSKGDGYIELCAPEVEIIGRRCTEFTTGGKFLQEHLESKCATCPFKYNSSESYKYDECYKLEFPRNLPSTIKEKTIETSTNTQVVIVTKNDGRSLNDAVEDTEDNFNVRSDDEETNTFTLIVAVGCVITFVSIVIFLVVGILFLRRKMCHPMYGHKKNGRSDVGEQERLPTEEI
ncbi:uncharacterized protein LOC134273505 [Saccostrea cucullata]|uniref:uncharacterized protein LOC134273505 n=1 Tax=Saccostrea cuccullata TaxID=36930 RepID=UPI002ED289D7